MCEKCLVCKKRISSANCRNLQCKVCKKYCHSKCTRNLPPICLEKAGKFRYRIVRNEKWKCDICTSNELPFSNVSNARIREMRTIHKRKLPSTDELNALFVSETAENDDDIEFKYSYKTQYMTSREIENLNFKDESELYEDFPILSINVRSIVNRDHFMKFESLLDSLPIKPMVIGLSETWVSESSKGSFLNLQGYKFVQNSRDKCVGGGVGFYVADHLHYSEIDSLTIMNEKLFESIFINVDVDGKNIVCGSVYRKSQNAGHEIFINNIKNVLKQCEKMNKPTIIMGDLNYNLLNTDDIHVNSCVDNFFDFGFFPLINIPTRITDTTGTVLDHIWTNIVENPIKSAVIADLVADHLPVYMNLGMQKCLSNEKVMVEKRCFF